MRGLITDDRYQELFSELVDLRQMLNGYLRSIGKSAN